MAEQHKADVRQMGRVELIQYQTGRIEEWRASGRFEDDAALVAKVNEELAVFDEHGPWHAGCACGWLGNNPYPSKDDAVEVLLGSDDIDTLRKAWEVIGRILPEGEE